MKNPYPGTEEIAPGVFLYQDHDEHLNQCGAPEIYFADEKGEICMWSYREMQEDPGAWTACCRALAMGIKKLRETFPNGFPGNDR